VRFARRLRPTTGWFVFSNAAIPLPIRRSVLERFFGGAFGLAGIDLAAELFFDRIDHAAAAMKPTRSQWRRSASLKIDALARSPFLMRRCAA
jgi:hypothetical protein